MTTNRSLAVGCLVLVVLATRLSAGEEPSFLLEECAWPATDIVVVAQGGPQGAPWTVLEMWKGDLVTGATIEVVGLWAAPLDVSTGHKSAVKSVSGGRIILFLKHAAPKDDDIPLTPPAVGRFEGTARFGGTQVSAVWVEKDQAYAFMQIINPGPTELQPLGQTETQLKKQTLAMLAAKDELGKAKAIEDPLDRAQSLGPMATKGRYWHKEKEAFAAMSDCGKPALPLLHAMLHVDRYDQSDLVRAIAGAAGTDAGKEMMAILQDELVYWKSAAPSLRVGWWNADPAPRRELLRNRYGLLDTSLRVLTELPYPPSRDLVTQVRDFWSSLPQLNDKSGLNQIIDECNGVLKALDTPARPPKTITPGQ